MGRQLKEEEANMAKLRDQPKQHEESAKEKKSKLAAVKVELDEAVEDLNEARKKEADNDSGDDDAAAKEMAAPAPGSTPTPSPAPTLAETQLAEAEDGGCGGDRRVKRYAMLVYAAIAGGGTWALVRGSGPGNQSDHEWGHKNWGGSGRCRGPVLETRGQSRPRRDCRQVYQTTRTRQTSGLPREHKLAAVSQSRRCDFSKADLWAL